MAGVILDVLPVMRLDFSLVTAGQTQRQQLTPRPIGVSAYTEGTLLVRVHSLTISASHTIVVKAVLVAPTEEDPAMLFWLPDAPVASVTIDANTVAPSAEQGTLLKGSLSANFGAALVIVVEGYRPAVGASDLKAAISVGMCLKGRSSRRLFAAAPLARELRSTIPSNGIVKANKTYEPLVHEGLITTYSESTKIAEQFSTELATSGLNKLVLSDPTKLSEVTADFLPQVLLKGTWG